MHVQNLTQIVENQFETRIKCNHSDNGPGFFVERKHPNLEFFLKIFLVCLCYASTYVAHCHPCSRRGAFFGFSKWHKGLCCIRFGYKRNFYFQTCYFSMLFFTKWPSHSLNPVFPTMPLLFLFPLTHYTFLPSSLITTPSPNQTTPPSLLQHM